jgi:hypothetical protein
MGKKYRERTNEYATALAGQVGARPMPVSKSKPKKTDVQISIRKNNPAGYVISVYMTLPYVYIRPSNNKYGPSVSEEFYMARTIEEVETITSSLLRHGSVPKELGGA